MRPIFSRRSNQYRSRRTILVAASIVSLAFSTSVIAQSQTKPTTPQTEAAKPDKMSSSKVDETKNDEAKPMNSNSILLKEWIGPYGGVPPWRMVKREEFVDAFGVAMAEHTKEIDAIANNPEPPTFENTIVAMEKAGKMLDRVQTIFGVYASSLNTGPISDIEKAVAPMMSKHGDAITQNEALFKRIEAVYQSEEQKAKLDVAQQRLLEDNYKSFVRRGAKLDAEQKRKLTDINQQLAGFFVNFSKNVMDDEADYETWIYDEKDLEGLPESVKTAMATACKERKDKAPEGAKWCVTNTRSSMDPFLTKADNRELRKEVWTKYYNRGDNGGERDNNEIISRILKAASRTR